MRRFVIKAHKAPADPIVFLGQVNRGAHVEYLASCVLNALFLSKKHRDNTVLYLVLEGARDFSRTVILDGSKLGSIGGLDESSLLGILALALRESAGLHKSGVKVCSNGISVEGISFERLVRRLAQDQLMILLDKKAPSLLNFECLESEQPVFVLTDHIPLNKKAKTYLQRLGARQASLGPLMLHASQCITVVHNIMDTRG